MSDMGKKIAERRKELGFTQEELAAKVGYKSKSTINKIELGINGVPQSKVTRFAEVLGVTVAWLMGIDNSKPLGITEEQAIALFRELNKEGQAMAITMLKVLTKTPEYIKNYPDKAVEGIA